MNMDLTYELNRIIIVLAYEKNISSSGIGKSLMGIEGSKPNIINEIKVKLNLGTEPIRCECVSLIKQPSKIGDIGHSNAPRGIIAIYRYIGRETDKGHFLIEFRKYITELVQNKELKSFNNCKIKNIIVGNPIEHSDGLKEFDYAQNKIILKLDFHYRSDHFAKGEWAFPGEIRKTLINHPRGSPKLLDKINERLTLSEQIFSSESFSLIKYFSKAKESGTVNTAIGAIAIYKFIGDIALKSKAFNTFLEIIQDLSEQSAPGKLKECTKREIFVGVDLENVETE